MLRKLMLGSACVATVLFTASDASAFRGRHHRGNACGQASYGYSNYGYSNYGYSAPASSYYRAPNYGYGYPSYGYGRSSSYRPAVSIGIGGSPFGYNSGYYNSGYGGYGLGGYRGYGVGRSGVSLGIGGLGW